MAENKLIPLDFGQIKDLVSSMNNEYRFIHHSFGFVKSFAGVKDVIQQWAFFEQPYRLIEGRIMYLFKGEACINLNLRERHLKAPMAIVISPGTIGEIKSFSSDCDFSMFAFQNSFMDSFRRESLLQLYSQRRLCLCIPLQETDRLRMETLWNLFWDILHDQPLPEEMIKEMILLIFRQIDVYRQQYISDNKQTVSRQEDVLNHFIDLVNEYAIQERKIPFYADKLCLTPHYLSTIIRKTSHQTIMDWINRAVIQEAKLLLRHSDLQISQISDKLNFPNVSFFCKFFRRLTGMSPGEYQKSTTQR